MSPRLLRVLAPLLAILTALFALYQLFVAGLALRLHRWPFVAFYAVLGVAGLAISSALWRTGRRIR